MNNELSKISQLECVNKYISLTTDFELYTYLGIDIFIQKIKTYERYFFDYVIDTHAIKRYKNIIKVYDNISNNNIIISNKYIKLSYFFNTSNTDNIMIKYTNNKYDYLRNIKNEKDLVLSDNILILFNDIISKLNIKHIFIKNDIFKDKNCIYFLTDKLSILVYYNN